MQLSAIVRKIGALCLLLTCGTASATVLTLPSPNAYEGQLFNNFNVYSLDLLSKCSSDPRCQPQAGVPVASSPGQIADQAVILSSANGMSNFTSPFATGSAVDDVFLSPTGMQSATYPNPPTFGNDAGGQFAGDQAFTWEINLGLLQSYLGLHDLVFLFDNNQGNANGGGNISIWAQMRIIDTTGNTMGGQCYEVSQAGANAGCVGGSYLPVLSSLCVANDGSYNTIGAANQAACPAGSIFVDNNVGSSTAEYAIYTQSLSNAVKNAANANYLLSIDVRYFGNVSGAEQLWICNTCDVGPSSVPEPGSLLLLALGLAALLVSDAMKARRR